MSLIKQCTIRFNMGSPNEQKIYEYLIAKAREKNVSQNHFILQLLEAEMNGVKAPAIDSDYLIQQIVNGVVTNLTDKVISIAPDVADNTTSAKVDDSNQLNEDAMDFLSIF